MSLLDMVGLHKSLFSSLPIDRQSLAHVGFDIAVANIEVFKMLGQYAKKLIKGLCLSIEINENKPRPSVNQDLSKTVRFSAYMREIPRLWHLDQLTI